MAQIRPTFDPNRPDVVEKSQRRAPPLAESPATVPSGEERINDPRPTEDGGVAQHPVHDSDTEDLGPEDYEERIDEAAKVGIKPLT